MVLMLALALSGPSGVAIGADYPTKPITLVIPFPPAAAPIQWAAP
jgi:hypothetical protein